MALAVSSAVRLYRTAAGTLRGNARPAFRLKEVVKRRSTYLRLSVAVIVSAALIVISAGAVFGQRPLAPSIPRSSQRTWIPAALEYMGYSPFANLNHVDVSSKPSDWLGKKDEELDHVKGADLAHKNLRYAQANQAFLAKANLSGSDLYGISLADADLRQSNLAHSDLQRAELNGALMQGSDIEEADLDYASLLNAQLKGANLFHSSLYHADLSFADLSGANLGRANLRGVDLGGAVIKYADFRDVTAAPAKEEILKSIDWNLAFFLSEMLSQLDLPPDHNEKLEQQMCADPAAVTAENVGFLCPFFKK
ncbi:MAG TPA: pentapeptide repeat-containing protein [Candidatus Angelobacter sp.]